MLCLHMLTLLVLHRIPSHCYQDCNILLSTLDLEVILCIFTRWRFCVHVLLGIEIQYPLFLRLRKSKEMKELSGNDRPLFCKNGVCSSKCHPFLPEQHGLKHEGLVQRGGCQTGHMSPFLLTEIRPGLPNTMPPQRLVELLCISTKRVDVVHQY